MNSGAAEQAIHFALPDITDAEVDAVVRILRSRWLTTGDECRLLEQELADWIGAPHVVSMSSCTAALETAFAYLRLNPGARVGVPTWTFAASALAPCRHGGEIVLLDVDPVTLNVSSDSTAASVEAGLDALVAVHIGGHPVHQLVFDICRDYSIPVVEDSAHAFGTIGAHRVQPGGSVASCLSFYATKNLTSAEGGALVTADDDLADFARRFRLHGMSSDAWERYRPGKPPVYDVSVPGLKANLPDVLAAIARVQLSRFAEMQRRRRELVMAYRSRLASVAGVTCIPPAHDERSSDHLMMVLFEDGVLRDAAFEVLASRGVGTSVHFTPLHRLTWIREHSTVGPSGVGCAESMADRVLSLPLHSTMTVSDVDRVCDVLQSLRQ